MILRIFFDNFLDTTPVRCFAATALLCRSLLFLSIGRHYRAMSDLCRVVRISAKGPLRSLAYNAVMRAIGAMNATDGNALRESYLADVASRRCAESYSIGGRGQRDIFRDLIVLKRASSEGKGVILLKYARTFDAVISLFDVSRLMARYIFVLEPCWAGYCDPSILMFISSGHPVFVQCFTEEDRQFITDVGAPLVPVRLGPADWVDADLFTPIESVAKRYDLVMVANWAPRKRHAQLFRALRQIRNRQIRVLLIGFPWWGRTAEDIKREARAARLEHVQFHIVERIAPELVARYLNECKIFVFLSRKEGDNKALVEAMFAGLPAIVYEGSIGGAKSRINSFTGILSSDTDLSNSISYMLDHHEDFSPRDWALQHTGSKVATRSLNHTIREVVEDLGGKYGEDIAEKTNSPNLCYKESGSRERFLADYEFVLDCRRGPHVK